MASCNGDVVGTETKHGPPDRNNQSFTSQSTESAAGTALGPSSALHRVWRGKVQGSFQGSTRQVQVWEEQQFKNGKGRLRPEYKNDECQVKAPAFVFRPGRCLGAVGIQGHRHTCDQKALRVWGSRPSHTGSNDLESGTLTSRSHLHTIAILAQNP